MTRMLTDVVNTAHAFLTGVLRTAHGLATLALLVLGTMKLSELLRASGWGESGVLLSIAVLMFVGVFMLQGGVVEREEYQLLRRERDEIRDRVLRYEETLREIGSETAESEHEAGCDAAYVAKAALASEREILAVAEDYEETSSHWKWCPRCQKPLPTFTNLSWAATAPRAVRVRGEADGESDDDTDGPSSYHCSVCKTAVDDWINQGMTGGDVMVMVLLGLALLWWLFS